MVPVSLLLMIIVGVSCGMLIYSRVYFVFTSVKTIRIHIVLGITLPAEPQLLDQVFSFVVLNLVLQVNDSCNQN